MAASPRQRVILPLAPLGAGVAGGFVALLFLVMPSGALESLVVDSGIASVVNAAQPPLHFTARAVLALGGGGLVALLAWVALFVAFGTRSVMVQTPVAAGDDAAPTLRRADAHPDAPPRRPVFANRDLGTPFLEIRAEASLPATPEVMEPIVEVVPAPAPAPMGAAEERALPVDLDLPLAAFDPYAIPLTPAAFAPSRPEAFEPEPIRPAPLLVTPIHTEEEPEIFNLATRRQPAPVEPLPLETADRVAERFRLLAAKMVDLTPPTPPVERPAADPATSIRALLDRLERSVAQREAAAPPAPAPTRHDSIRETLDTLRTLATRAG